MVAFSLFGISIYWYGLSYFFAFLFAYVFFLFLVRKKIFAVSAPELHTFLSSSFEDFLIWVFVGVLLGGRLGHIFIYDFSYYIAHPLKIIAFWEGGMSFIGGIVGTFLALLFFFVKNKYSWRVFSLLLDVLFIPVGLGIMFGRIANFLNQELYGIIVPHDFWGLSGRLVGWAMHLHMFHVYPLVDTALRLNTNFLASFGEGFLLLVFQILLACGTWRKSRFIPGYGVSLFVLWYSFVRFLLEYVRYDSQQEIFGLFSKSQWFFLGFFVVGCFFLFYRVFFASRKQELD